MLRDLFFWAMCWHSHDGKLHPCGAGAVVIQIMFLIAFSLVFTQ